MLVDDAPFIREAMRTLLESEGHRVMAEATDGLEAVKALASSEPDLVILDLVLPKKNGLMVMKEILEIKPHLKFLVCSTESNKALMTQALVVGGVDFLAKPFDRATFLKKIKKLEA
jgi:two-component system, chemotaxis family, chemotaxis protein CheY